MQGKVGIKRMQWINKEHKKKAKLIEREMKSVQTELRKVELTGHYSDKEMDEKEQRIEQLKSRLADLETELNRLWHLDKGGTLRVAQQDADQEEDLDEEVRRL
jgi:septal ring factor EnvC (AmiA/AmiB activator)